MSDETNKNSKIKLGLSLFWFLYTFALVVWWWIFSLRQLDLLIDVINPTKLQSMKRMLIGEGAVLVSTVFFGGLVLVFLTYREQSRNKVLRNFFANFTHDLKTSLTRLRLRTEVLAEKNSSPEFQKLLAEASRLDLQLENSLWVAKTASYKLLQEKIRLSSVLGFLRAEWPDLEVSLKQDVNLLADEQALRSVFRNILQNAWLHGKATKIEVIPLREKEFWALEVIDNGIGFNGEISQLGGELLRSQKANSNGLGVFLTQDLMKRMKGNITFHKLDKGFKVRLLIPAGEALNV